MIRSRHAARPLEQKPALRKRLYETGAAVLTVLTVWGVVTADEADQYLELLDKALPAVALVIARLNVRS